MILDFTFMGKYLNPINHSNHDQKSFLSYCPAYSG